MVEAQGSPARGNPVNRHAAVTERALHSSAPMTSSELGRVVQAIIVAAVAATALGSLTACEIDDDPCVEVLRKTVIFDDPPDPSLHLQIESCRLDTDACQQLCRTALDRAQLDGELRECGVDFVSSTRVDVNVGYVAEVIRPGCPVNDHGDDGDGGGPVFAPGHRSHGADGLPSPSSAHKLRSRSHRAQSTGGSS
jgi:hypothetical protein